AALGRRAAARESALSRRARRGQRRLVLASVRRIHLHDVGHARDLARRAPVPHAAAGRQLLVREHRRSPLVQSVERRSGPALDQHAADVLMLAWAGFIRFLGAAGILGLLAVFFSYL